MARRKVHICLLAIESKNIVNNKLKNTKNSQHRQLFKTRKQIWWIVQHQEDKSVAIVDYPGPIVVKVAPLKDKRFENAMNKITMPEFVVAVCNQTGNLVTQDQKFTRRNYNQHNIQKFAHKVDQHSNSPNTSDEEYLCTCM